MSPRIHARIAIAPLLVASLLAAFAPLLLAGPDKEKVRVEAAHVVSQRQDAKVRVTTLSTARIYHDDSTFSAENVVIRSEGDVHEFTCTGSPVFTDPENRITGDKVVAQSTPRRAEFVGSVKMVSTPKKKQGESEIRGKVTGEPTTTTCDSLSYDYGKKTGIARGHVVAAQKSRTIWADEAIYDQSVELITLKGNLRLKNTGEEELKELTDAETATISLDNDWIDIVARPGGFITMELLVESEEKKPEAGKK